MLRVAERLREQRVTPLVEAGFLNYSQPTFEEAVAKVQAQGATNVIVQPYFLVQGHFAATEVPALVRKVADNFPQLRFVIADTFGAHPALVKLARKRLAALHPEPGHPPARATGVLFIAHGSPKQAVNEPVERVLTLVQQQSGYSAGITGYLDCNQPDIPAAFAGLAANGIQRIDVLPYFLHMGRHVCEDLPMLIAQARREHPEVAIHVAHHLDFDLLLADVAAERVMENLMC